jgi:poly-gamma-glutamate system protein
MKKLYWRPQKASWKTVLIIASIAAIALITVESSKRAVNDPLLDAKVAAASRAEQGMAVIKAERERLGHPIDPELDPSQSGMIGKTLTPVTSVSGHLNAKQTSVNPNFAAAIVEMLGQSGVKQGDVVAVGCSGSFPALNLAVFAAMEEMKVKPIVICSIAASQFGANIPDLMWPDMERLLHERGVLSFRSVATTLGGYEDRVAGMSDEGKQLIHDVIERNGLEQLDSSTYDKSLEQRMMIYDKQAAGKKVKAYINVGGGTVSVGRSLGKHLYHSGLNLEPPPGAADIDSVMTAFAKRDAAVIHLSGIRDLAIAYGFPQAPTTLPKVGKGNVYGQPQYNRWIAAAMLVVILAVLRAFILKPTGSRWLDFLRSKFVRGGKHASSPHKQASGELMV